MWIHDHQGLGMNKRARNVEVEVEVEELKDSKPSADGAGVVLETEARVDGSLHDTSIQVQEEDVPAVASALLNVEAHGNHPEGMPATPVRCLGAGVVHWDTPDDVRLHLQFDSGQVLPVLMSKDAALVLCRGLFAHTGAATVFDLQTWTREPAPTKPKR